MPLSSPRVAAAVTLALVAAGCHSNHNRNMRPGDAAQVRQTVQMALADLARDDGPGFCALTTTAARAQLSRLARTGLLHARVGPVTINGSTAEVSAANITLGQSMLTGFLNDGGKPTSLIRQPDGSWKIN